MQLRPYCTVPEANGLISGIIQSEPGWPAKGEKKKMQRLWVPAVSLVLFSGLSFASPDKGDSDSGHKKHEFGFHWNKGRLGVEALNISTPVRQALGAPADVGVLVNEVESNSAAAEAGVKAGDVIVAIDGHPVAAVRDIRRLLSRKDVGQKAEVEVIRQKSRQTVTATLKEVQPMLGFDHLLGEDGSFLEGFGPKLRKDLEKLQERVAELEKKLQSAMPGR
jgi:S1-C subfamily serine protease